jgi:hypothetical protein
MLTLTDRLLKVADAYCAKVERSRARISTIIFGSGDRIDGVAEGKDLNTRSFERAMQWFSSNWPDGLIWPEGVERPQPQQLGESPPSQADEAVA